MDGGGVDRFFAFSDDCRNYLCLNRGDLTRLLQGVRSYQDKCHGISGNFVPILLPAGQEYTRLSFLVIAIAKTGRQQVGRPGICVLSHRIFLISDRPGL